MIKSYPHTRWDTFFPEPASSRTVSIFYSRGLLSLTTPGNPYRGIVVRRAKRPLRCPARTCTARAIGCKPAHTYSDSVPRECELHVRTPPTDIKSKLAPLTRLGYVCQASGRNDGAHSECQVFLHLRTSKLANRISRCYKSASWNQGMLLAGCLKPVPIRTQGDSNERCT